MLHIYHMHVAIQVQIIVQGRTPNVMLYIDFLNRVSKDRVWKLNWHLARFEKDISTKTARIFSIETLQVITLKQRLITYGDSQVTFNSTTGCIFTCIGGSDQRGKRSAVDPPKPCFRKWSDTSSIEGLEAKNETWQRHKEMFWTM